MPKIDNNNLVFSTKPFINDKYAFSLILGIISSPEALIYSDEKSYIIARGQKGLPTWIWTSDDIKPEAINAAIKEMEYFIEEDEKAKFTCKKSFYEILLSMSPEFLSTDDYFEMGSLYCKEAKKPKPCSGNLDMPTEKDRDVLINYWYNASKDMNGVEDITIEQAAQDVERFLASDTFFVWRVQGEVVSMGMYTVEGDNQVRINHVFTPLNQRGNGYAANLIYEMSRALLYDGLTPVLYTDYNYPAANKTYINAGYTPGGVLINFSCSRQRRLN